MPRLVRSIRAGFLKSLLFTKLPNPSIGQISACLSIFGLATLAFLAGNTVMFFHLPPSSYLTKAFEGAQAWRERRQKVPLPPSREGPPQVKVYEPGKTSDGFTLYTTVQDCQATLMDMQGNIVHQWKKPFSEVWPKAPHVHDQLSDDRIHWFRSHLFPNGDLLAIYHAMGDTPYGYGLVKLNKDSQILWSYPGRVHHDLDIGEDGNIYTLTQELVGEPPPDLGFLSGPYIADYLVVLSPEGKELQRISILDAFRNSPYVLTLMSSVKEFQTSPGFAPMMMSPVPINPLGGPQPPGGQPRPPAPGGKIPPQKPQAYGEDISHTNSVKVLTKALAPKFSLFKAGQVLISLLSLNTVAVLDLNSRTIVWAGCGAWRHQHDATFLDSGHLLLYDNAGSSQGTRVIEYDPITQAMSWIYANENTKPFHASARGMKQRLTNGNTLIVDPDNGRLFEVTRDKEFVWECLCPGGILTGARRYGVKELSFLEPQTKTRH